MTPEQRERLMAVINRQPTNPPAPRLSIDEIDLLRALVEQGREVDAWAELEYRANLAFAKTLEAIRLRSVQGFAATKEKPYKAEQLDKTGSTENYVRRHITERRRDDLSPVIEKAIKQLGSKDYHQVWALLVEWATSANKPPPIAGFTAEGIQYRGKKYQADGELDVLTKKALGQRLRRLMSS